MAEEIKEMTYDKELMKKITGIEDEDLLDFYIKAIITKIEKYIGYKLVKGEIKEIIEGLSSTYLYIKRRDFESVSNVTDACEKNNIPFSYVGRKIIFDEIIPVGTYVVVTYTAGYEKIPEFLLLFIAQMVNEASTNKKGLKSYSIKGISYTYLSRIEQSDNFINGVRDLFGVVEF